MKAKKVIISIFNILFIILCLGIITLGAFSLISVIGGKSFANGEIAKFISNSSNAIFNPINLALAALLRPMKIAAKFLSITSIIIPIAICLLIAVISLIVLIQVLKDKKCKATSIINIILSILGVALILTCLFVLISNKTIRNLIPFIQSHWLFLTFGIVCLLSFGVHLIACITSGYVPKSEMATIPNQQGAQFNGYANNPQVNQAQPNAMPASAQPYATQNGYTQQATPQTNTSQPNQYSQPQMGATQTTPFVSSVQPPSNPFEATPSATNNAFTNPTGSYSTTQSTSYSNPATAYTSNPTSSFSNPANAYQPGTSTQPQPMQTGVTQPTTPYQASPTPVTPTQTDMPAGTMGQTNPVQPNSGFPTDPNNQ